MHFCSGAPAHICAALTKASMRASAIGLSQLGRPCYAEHRLRLQDSIVAVGAAYVDGCCYV
jgi:hypothetical protein